METQDHKLPKLSGHEGQVHVCQKCGWPFPNPHPSAKHRRAHKKVCGTVEGYKLGDYVADKTQVMDGSDGEHVSDDEGKSPSIKVENFISRKSSSGVGSRSSRSTRSEDELFADAATDFTDGSGSGDASEGVMQRFYSLQNDSEDTNYAAENAIADNASAPNLLLKDHEDQVQTVPKLTSENDTVEAGVASQDHTPSSATGPVEQDTEEFSKTPHEQDIAANESKEINSSEEKPEMRISYNNPALEATEDVSGLRTTNEEIQCPIPVAKLTGIESASSENNIEHLHVVDAVGNVSSIEHSFEVIDATNGSASKLNGAMEDHGLKAESSDDFHVLAVADALPLHRHPDVIVEDPEVIVEDPEVGDSQKICSEDNDPKIVDGMVGKLKHDVGQNSIVDLNAVGEPGKISDVEDSYADGSEHRSEVATKFSTESFENENVSSGVEEQKPVVSMENALPEGGISVKNSTEHVLLDMDNSDVTGIEPAGSSLSVDSATGDIPAQDKELGSVCHSKETGNDGKTGDVQPHLEGNERCEGKDTRPGYGLSIAGSHDAMEKPLEPERTYDHGESDVTQDSRDVIVDHSLPLVDSTENSGGGDSIGEDGHGVLKSDHLRGLISNTIPGEVLEVREDAQCSLESSAVNDTCACKVAEETSGGGESDRNNPIKLHLAISAVDVPDSSSQADSLEGNWGSVSVMSALSDTPPTADTPASIDSQASPAEQNASREPKSVAESQQTDSQTSGDPNVTVRKMEGISEIQTLEEQQPKGASSSSASHVENGGKLDEEIIAKVTNWSTEKNHTPLKTLLGEATARSRAESPIHYNQNQSSTSMALKDENNGLSKTNDPTTETSNSKEEVGKEWNSPARYPVNIKTEKKRGRTKTWMPFFCCSSVNAR